MSIALMDALEMLAELEFEAEDMTMLGSKRRYRARRKSLSCSRLAPEPLPDLLLFERLCMNREASPTVPISNCVTPVVEEVMQTGSGSSTVSIARLERESEQSMSLQELPVENDKPRLSRKSWFHPKTWMRKRRQQKSIIETSVTILTPQLRDMTLGAFCTEQVMKPTEAFQ